MSDQEEDNQSAEAPDAQSPNKDDYGSESESGESDDAPAPSKWGHFDDENDEVNETFHTLMEDFIVERQAMADDPAVEDKYLQDHWAELMQYVCNRAGDYEPVLAGVALRLARRGQYGPEDEGTIPKPPLIQGFPEVLRQKALEDTQFSLDELTRAGSAESAEWENVELRQACLEMQLHLFSNGTKPAPVGFEAKMKTFLDQRANEASAAEGGVDPAEGDLSGEDDGEGLKRGREDEEEETEGASKKPKTG